MEASIALTHRPYSTAVVCAVTVLALAVAAIAGVFAFQAAGYAPCELCLKERLPYYAGIVLAVVTVWLTITGATTLARSVFVVLALLFVFSAAFGAFHAGVEWGFWPGPAECTGALGRASTNADFLHQLQSVKIVRCDAAAIRILGLSLAGWNVVVSLAIAASAGLGAVRAGRVPA